MRLPVVLVVPSLFAILGGCTAPAPPMAPAAGPADLGAEAWLASFDLSLQGCREGGGVTVFNMAPGSPGPAPPLVRADHRGELGNPSLTSDNPQPRPVEGATTGMWHITWLCDSYVWKGERRSGFAAGWIGVLIEPPPWETEGAPGRQFFVGDLSLADPDIRESLHAAGIHVAPLLEARAEWMAPGTLHTLVDDADHGRFETHAKMRPTRDSPASDTRLWFYLHVGETPQPDGTSEPVFRPVSLDLADTSIEVQYVEGFGRFSHTRTQSHPPPGALDNVGGLLWEGFDRVVTVGPSAPVLFNRTWVH